MSNNQPRTNVPVIVRPRNRAKAKQNITINVAPPLVNGSATVPIANGGTRFVLNIPSTHQATIGLPVPSPVKAKKPKGPVVIVKPGLIRNKQSSSHPVIPTIPTVAFNAASGATSPRGLAVPIRHVAPIVASPRAVYATPGAGVTIHHHHHKHTVPVVKPWSPTHTSGHVGPHSPIKIATQVPMSPVRTPVSPVVIRPVSPRHAVHVNPYGLSPVVESPVVIRPVSPRLVAPISPRKMSPVIASPVIASPTVPASPRNMSPVIAGPSLPASPRNMSPVIAGPSLPASPRKMSPVTASPALPASPRNMSPTGVLPMPRPISPRVAPAGQLSPRSVTQLGTSPRSPTQITRPVSPRTIVPIPIVSPQTF
jgi:hypothetical protein